MKIFSRKRAIAVLSVAVAASFASAAISRAQSAAAAAGAGSGASGGGSFGDPRTALAAGEIALNSVAGKGVTPEDKAYKAFYDARMESPDKRIQLGAEFVRKYPTSHYASSVYGGLVRAYYSKQDWTDFYGSADKALALNPDNVDVLAIVGWEIPHDYNPNDPDADKKLDKAETYAKHAVELMGTLPKPVAMTDEQFAAVKANTIAEAHSALGLVYFRRRQFEEAAREFQQATQVPSPDPLDIYSLGVSLHNIQRDGDAAQAFARCAQIPGELQDRCKQRADAMKTQVPQSK